MKTRIEHWGPAAWTFLHAMSFKYTPTIDDKANMRIFLKSFARALPCEKCRLHFVEYIDTRLEEEHLRDRESLARFLVAAHNDVNARLGKRQLTYYEVKKMYTEVPPYRWFILIVIVCIVGILALNYRSCLCRNKK